VTAIELSRDDLDVIRATVASELIETVWAGDALTTELEPDLHVLDAETTEDAVHRIKSLLLDKGIIFRPW
jgi:bifunctional enzyme CysN/CysC